MVYNKLMNAGRVSPRFGDFLPTSPLPRMWMLSFTSTSSSMAETRTIHKTSPFLFMFLVLTTTTLPQPASSIPLTQFQTLTSLAHSLMSRVANLRAARGDEAGSERAKMIASKIERGLGLGLWNVMWSMGWDYVKHYAWRDMSSAELIGAVSDVNELLRSVGDLARVNSERDRAVWIQRNYQRLFEVSKSLFSRLLRVFSRSGAMREVVETIQKEVVDGGLLRDCLEVSSNDLNGVLQVLKDLAGRYMSSTSREDSYDL